MSAPKCLLVLICFAVLPALGKAQAPIPAPSDSRQSANDGEFQRLLDELSRAGESLGRAKAPADVVSAAMRQVDVLSQLAAHANPEDRASWLRQVADTLQLAASNSPASDRTALDRLASFSQQVGQSMPGSPVAAYIVFRELQADYAAKISDPNADVTKVQQAWRDRLVAFVQANPDADDTASAMMELAAVSQSLGQKAEAKGWYQQVAQSFRGKPAAMEAEGNLHWLDLQDHVLRLTLPLLLTDNDQQDEPFDIDQLRGKVVVVYFWSTREQRARGEIDELNQLANQYQSKGLRLLCVNMDNEPKDASNFLGDPRTTAVHVFQRGGLQGPLARRYGMTALPRLLLLARDGKVLLQPAGVGELGECLREGARKQETEVRSQRSEVRGQESDK
jgi:thiol-disulfide isomerase/thioredoxin